MREQQRLTRVLNAMDALDALGAGREASSLEYQELVRDLNNTLHEVLTYDPVADPLLLVTEIEFHVGFWRDQVPVIRQLMPRGKLGSLVELAMGLGKTDIITPAVLTLLADGLTLPVLVMPEALVPSMAARLQSRLGPAFRGEIRVIPVNRVNYTSGDILRLRDELSTMMRGGASLVWSATDVQTLINLYIEHLEDCREGTEGHDVSSHSAWQQLFGFFRSAVVIVGDEIHAILDILTSYNFALGGEEFLHKDEMDAVADFIQVVVDPDRPISRETEFPFMRSSRGEPLTESRFKDHVSNQIIEALLERGIIDTTRSRQLLAQRPEVIPKIREYLRSEKGADSAFLASQLRFPELTKTPFKRSGRKAWNRQGLYLTNSFRWTGSA